MDNFIQMPGEERRVYFEQAAARLGLGLTAQLIEKDFWVCWSLKRLFALDEFHQHLTFKGGTSLSKVYNAINRFSEDVDMSIDRSFLGFGGDNEPEKGASGKEQQRRITRLREACKIAIHDQLMPQLRAAVSSHIDQAEWSLTFDPHDDDEQTLLFRYPAAVIKDLNLYSRQWVKIELGARSDHYPVEDATVAPYLCDAIPDAIADSVTFVRVLRAERTFWEKATILHMLHHWPEGKKVALGMSRHYYDVFQLSNSSVVERAMKNLDLLDRVATHKQVFFKVASARYDTARPGTLRLYPRDEMVSELKRDYAAMQGMFFDESPTFDAILHNLRELEHQINRT